MWLPFSGATERVVNPDNLDAAAAAQYPDRPSMSDVPFQPWAKELYLYRRGNQFEPHTRCKPSGGPRQFLTPYGVEFVDLPELHRIFIMDQGGPHTYRTIYMDVKSHPKDLVPSYYGHSIGHWEGDTLVVDTTNFSDKTTLRGSGPGLHVIERFSLADGNTLRYQFTVDDPASFVRSWSGESAMTRTDERMFEYACHEGNQSLPNTMRGRRFTERQEDSNGLKPVSK
jgi:hypothetical protein